MYLVKYRKYILHTKNNFTTKGKWKYGVMNQLQLSRGLICKSKFEIHSVPGTVEHNNRTWTLCWHILKSFNYTVNMELKRLPTYINFCETAITQEFLISYLRKQNTLLLKFKMKCYGWNFKRRILGGMYIFKMFKIDI